MGCLPRHREQGLLHTADGPGVEAPFAFLDEQVEALAGIRRCSPAFFRLRLAPHGFSRMSAVEAMACVVEPAGRSEAGQYLSSSRRTQPGSCIQADGPPSRGRCGAVA